MTMIGGITFARVWNASGARNFFGDGYWFHRFARPIGLNFAGSTFVAKTTTVEPRTGNLPLGGPAGVMPRDLAPACIKVNLRRGAVLNAVGLSGPGLDALLATGRWQMRLDPFLLSFMAVDGQSTARISKAETFARKVAAERPRFRAAFGVEINLSCPNVGIDHGDLATEARAALTAMGRYLPGVPLVPKFNALVPPAVAREIATHPACAAVCVSNTIPWGKLPDRIDWRGFFGDVSPLAHLGGGGLSGAPLLPIVCDWLNQARQLPGGFPVPIVAGGGVLTADDAGMLFSAGAAAVELGSVAIVRPWRVAGIIRRCK